MILNALLHCCSWTETSLKHCSPAFMKQVLPMLTNPTNPPRRIRLAGQVFLVARSEVQRLNSLLPLESRCHEFSCVAQRHKILSPPYCNLWSLCFVTHFHRAIQDWQMFATLAAKPCDCEGIEDLCYWSILKRRSQLQPRQVATGNQSLKFSEGAVDSSWAVEALVQNLDKLHLLDVALVLLSILATKHFLNQFQQRWV